MAGSVWVTPHPSSVVRHVGELLALADVDLEDRCRGYARPTICAVELPARLVIIAAEVFQLEHGEPTGLDLIVRNQHCLCGRPDVRTVGRQ